jgi:hypothetical protein
MGFREAPPKIFSFFFLFKKASFPFETGIFSFGFGEKISFGKKNLGNKGAIIFSSPKKVVPGKKP